MTRTPLIPPTLVSIFLLASLLLTGCVGNDDAVPASHSAPVVLRPVSSSGTGWTNAAAVVSNDDAYAFAVEHEKFLTLPLGDSAFTGTITSVVFKVDQQQVNAADDRWFLYVHESTCGSMSMGNLNPVTTATRSVLSSTVTCANGWTWERINAATGFVSTSKSGGVDGQWRVFHAWLEVTFTNNAPNAHAGADQTVTESTVVTLDGSASNDPDGARDPLTYAWAQAGGPAVALTGATTAAPAFTAPTLSTNTPVALTFQLTVKDPNLDTGTDTVVVTVQNVNNAPTARAGADAVVEEGVEVLLNGTASSDPDGDAITYAWTQTGGPAVELSDAAAATPTFVAPQVPTQVPVELAFRLVVSDGITSSSPDDIIVRVDNVNAPPSVSAGDDKSAVEGASVTLTADGEDADGDTLSYAWTQTGGPAVTLSGAGTSQATFTAPGVPTNTPVTMAFRVTASDGIAHPASDVVEVTVTNVNRGPTADAGAAQTVEERATVTLDGSGSTDQDDDVLVYAWTQMSGENVTLSDPAAARPSFTAPELGVNQDLQLVFELVVGDGAVSSAADSVVVTVQNVNQPPLAQAGPDQIVDEGTTVTFDGTGSNDVDQDALSFSWTQTAGPAITLTGADTARPTFAAPSLSTNEAVVLTFQLVVRDGQTDSASDAVTVEVRNVNQPPVAEAGPDQNVNESSSVTLDGSGSSDPDLDTITYSWTQAGGPVVVLSDATTSQPSFTAPDVPTNTPVTVVLNLTVGDGRTFSTSGTVTVTVLNINGAPVVAAPPPLVVDEETSVALTIEAADPDADALTYAWTQTSGPTVTLDGQDTDTARFTAPTVPTSDPLLLGFEVAVDDGIAPAQTSSVEVTVRNVNQAPTVDAGADATVVEGTIVTFNGTVSDPDQDPTTVEWTQVSGQEVQLENATGLAPQFTAPQLPNATPLILGFSLTGSDGAVEANDTVTVTVTNANERPVAVPGADQIVNVRRLVTLDGSSSTDPDGDAITYEWTHTGGPTVSLAGATTAQPTFTAPSTTGTVVLTLVVTDAHGLESDSRSLLVTVRASGGGGSGGSAPETPTPTPDTASGAAVFPSSLLLPPGKTATLRVAGLDSSGLSLPGAAMECHWDSTFSGGELSGPEGGCVQEFTAGLEPGVQKRLYVNATLVTGQRVELTVPVLIGYEGVRVPVGDETGAVDVCESRLPASPGERVFPVFFDSRCGLHSIFVESAEVSSKNSTLLISVRPGHSSPPENFTGDAGLVLDLEWRDVEGAEIRVSHATIQFFIDKQWRDGICPHGVCEVTMFRLAGDGWTQLPTDFVTVEGIGERYRASSPGFSTFAAGGVIPFTTTEEPSQSPAAAWHPWASWLGLVAVMALIVGTGVLVAVRREKEAPQKPPAETPGSLAAILRELRRTEIVDFVGRAAHDMSSPVSTLGIQLHLLTKADEELTEEQRRALEIMGRSVSQLGLLVTDLQDAARLQAGRLKIEPKRTDLTVIVGQAAEDLAAKARAAGVVLEAERKSGVPVRADERRMTQVMTNLIENALKFTPDGGSIRVSVDVEDGRAVVRVADTGIGIPPEHVVHVFKPFTQVHEPGRQRQGSGLGLFICKGIVEAHGGDIEVESSARGEGTVMRFTLPTADTEDDDAGLTDV